MVQILLCILLGILLLVYWFVASTHFNLTFFQKRTIRSPAKRPTPLEEPPCAARRARTQTVKNIQKAVKEEEQTTTKRTPEHQPYFSQNPAGQNRVRSVFFRIVVGASFFVYCLRAVAAVA